MLVPIVRETIWEDRLSVLAKRLEENVAKHIPLNQDIRTFIGQKVRKGFDMDSWASLSTAGIVEWLDQEESNICTAARLAEYNGTSFTKISDRFLNLETTEKQRFMFTVLRYLIAMGTVHDQTTMLNVNADLTQLLYDTPSLVNTSPANMATRLSRH